MNRVRNRVLNRVSNRRAASARIRLLLLLIAAAPSIPAQIASVPDASVQDAPASSSSAPQTVRGTVVDSVTGEPIYRALVQIGGQYAALTDHEGRFEFDGVTSQAGPAWAMKPGYFSQDRFNHFAAVSAENGASPPATELIVKLVPEAIVSGTVTGQDGYPIEGMPVQLKTLTTQEGLARWRQRAQTRTNAEGQYRFAELEAGKYVVATEFHIEGPADAPAASGYVPARYPPPGGGSSTSETAMVLKPGDHAVADLNPSMERLFPVTGTVAGFAETRGVVFRAATPSGDEFTPNARFTPRTGEFRIMLPSGTYRVTATSYMRQRPMEATREVTVPQAPVRGLSFAMEPYASLPVDIEADTVNPPAQAGATPSLDAIGGNISLASADGEGFTPFLSAQPINRSGDQGGQLAIENVSPGRYVLRVQPPSPWYVAAASCGGVDLLHESLAVGEGSGSCSIRIVMRNDSGSAHVTIRDDGQSLIPSPQRRALYVYAVPLGNLAQPIVNFMQQNGDYSAEGLAPGRYLVLALDHRVDLPFRDPAAMQPYAELGQEISVAANGKADAEVSVAAGLP
jgi:protocatechuate 3,4-dioxygenase beta subunit